MDKEISVAVEWWGNVISDRAKQDNGDATTGALMILLTSGLPMPTEKQVAKFKDALAVVLSRELADGAAPYKRSIYNDYGVDVKLREAAAVAGIDAECPPFPMKTCMWVNPGRVSVRYGYGAKEQVLWEESHVSSHGEER